MSILLPGRTVRLALFAMLPLAVAGLVLLVASRTPQAPPTEPGTLAGAHRYDAPQAAEWYFESKRRDPAGRTNPAERYATARRRMADLDRFSSRMGRRLGSSGKADPVWASASGATVAPSAPGVLGTWTPLGPGNIGGRSRVLVINPNDPNVLFAGGVSGGVWRSDDAGEHWRPVADMMGNLAVNAIATHPAFPGVMYVGTGEGYFREEVRGTGLPLRGGGIYKTEDGGVTWGLLPSTATSDFNWVNDLLVSSGDHRRVYAATRSGLWRSLDSGVTWARLFDPAVRGGCLDLEIRRDRADDVLYASCGTFEPASVYRVMDAGGAAIVEIALREPGMGRTSLAIAPSRPDVVYALAASNEPGPYGTSQQGLHALYRSDGGGAAGTWTTQVSREDPLKLNRLLLTNPVSAMLVECRLGNQNSFSNMGWYANIVAVDPRDPDIVWVAGVDWFRSHDAGRTWGLVSHWWTEPTVPSFAHADQHAIVFHPAYDGAGNQTVFIAGDGGIFRSDNARAEATVGGLGVCNPRGSSVAWRSLNRGYGVTQFYHGVPFPDGRRFLGGTQDNGTIIGDEDSGFDGWRNIFGGDGGYVAIDPANPTTIYVETQWAAVRKSVDGGTTFTTVTRGLAPAVSDGISPNGNYLFITPFVIDPNDGRRLWLGGERIYQTTDGAANWRQASTPLDDGGKVSALTVSPDDSAHVAAGTHNGWVYHHAQAFDTSASSTWPGTRPQEGWVTSVAFHPGNADVLYATYGSFGGAHVYRSTDRGETWRSIDGVGDGALPDIPVHAIVIDRDDPQRIYLGTDLGVFVSTTGGEYWMVENTGFGAVVTESLSVADVAGRRVLFAFTHGRGAWKVDIR